MQEEALVIKNIFSCFSGMEASIKKRMTGSFMG